MKISKLVRALKTMQNKHGDVEVTCTGSSLPDWERQRGKGLPDVFETTVEKLEFRSQGDLAERVRLWM